MRQVLTLTPLYSCKLTKTNRDEDVAETMYKETLNAPKLGLHGDALQPGTTTQAVQPSISGSKINQICDAFLNALESRTSTHLQNIITAHVCKSPPDLDAGLTLIANLRGKLLLNLPFI